MRICIYTASRLLPVIPLLLPLTGCEQRPLGTSVSVTQAGWEFVYTGVHARRLTGAWSVAPGTVCVGYGQVEWMGDVGMVFDRGAVYYYDGVDWEDMEFPFTEWSENVDIWGTAPDNIYVADGKLQKFDGTVWLEQPVEASVVFGTASDDVYAADHQGIYRYDGEYWDLLYRYNYQSSVHAIWATNGPSVFVARYPGVLQLHGNIWQEVSLPIWVCDFWGSGPDDVYAVGGKNYSRDAAIWHFDGNEWSEVSIAEGGALQCIWGDGPNDIYAAGESGTMLHYDGNAWGDVPVPTARAFYDITGSGPNDVFAVGDNQKVAHFDGSGWRSMWNEVPAEVRELWAESPQRMAVAGYYQYVYILEDDEWRETFLDPPGYIMDLWGSSLNDLLAASSAGRIHRFDGSAWTVEVDLMEGSPYAIHGTGPSDVHVVGNGVIYHFDGSTWTNMLDNNEYELNAVWATDPGSAFAVGYNGVVMHFDGNGWSRMESGVTDELTDVWGASGEDVYAVGPAGMIHFDGHVWRKLPVYHGERLRWILGRAGDDIIAIGDWWNYSAFQLHYDGMTWNLEETRLETIDIVITEEGTIMQTTGRGGIFRSVP